VVAARSHSRIASPLVAISVASLAAIVLVYVLAPAEPQARAWMANAAWLWSAGYALFCTVQAGRLVPDSRERTAWRWIAGGCLSFLLGQLVWSYYELAVGSTAPYPSLADAGYLGLYVFFFIAVLGVWRPHQRRPLDAEVAIDALLVTFIMGALTYEFLLEPMREAGGSLLALLTSIAWAVGGVAVVWVILLQMLYRTQFPFGGAAFVLLGLLVLCGSNLAYAVSSLQGPYRSGGLLDLGWDAGFLLVAAAAAVATGRHHGPTAAASPAPGVAPRSVAIAIGLMGVAALAVYGALSPREEPDVAVLLVLGLTVIAFRVLYSLRSDRRYAEMLEREVAAQTRTLMDSLSATASAERHLRLVMESVPDAIVLLDREGGVSDLNAPGSELVALPGETAPDRSVFARVDAAVQRVVREHLDAAFAGEVRRFEVPFVRQNKSRGISAVIYAPVREGGTVSKVLALARDVTDLRRAESQLQQAEKLAAMGQLVSGVAHEINNPAAIISGFAQTLMLEELRPEQRDMVKMIHDEATRIGRITSNLLAFARAGGRERALVDVNDIARRTFALRSYHLSTLNIAVSLELDRTDPKIWGNGSELQQMLLNLLINAEQALVTVDGSRSITLRTRADELECAITCVDTGPGIPSEIRDRIFDPFFTTKPEGVGTGLGLSICYGIIQDHGGRITMDSEPGRGASFVVTLPRDPRTEARAPVESPAPPASVGAPIRVLVVDDEAGLRTAVARFLTRRGIQCRAVGDGAEALEALRFADYDVILSDVRMPGLNGREFLARLKETRPELVRRVVFSTGDTYASDTAALLKEAGLPTLVKPFDFTRLETLIREVAANVAP